MHQVNTPFIFYHDGVNPTHYAEGLCDIPADAAAVAEAEGWATPQANESEVVTSGDESDAAAVAEAEGKSKRGRK